MKQEPKTKGLEQAIDENLKRVYNDVASQEIPDRFTELLNKLRESEKASAPETQNG